MALDLSSSLRYPLNDEDAKKKILIGGACFFPGICLLAIPLIFLWGYGISAMRKVIRGEENELPEWELMADHFRFGLHALLISLGYYAIPIIVTIVSVGGSIFTLMSGQTDEGQHTIGIWFWLGSLLSGALSLAVAFILPMAIMTYAANDDMGAGFALGNIWEKIQANLKPYVLLVLANLVITFVVNLPQSILSNLPIIGILGLFVGGLLSTYGMLVLAHLNGTFYREHFGSHVNAHIHTTEGTGLEKERWQKPEEG